jgi:hypothetical protein
MHFALILARENFSYFSKHQQYSEKSNVESDDYFFHDKTGLVATRRLAA